MQGGKGGEFKRYGIQLHDFPVTGKPRCDRPVALARLPGERLSFAETALKLGGKSDEEVRRTGAIDQADEQVEALFAARFQTTASPIHRAVWERQLPVELFQSQTPAVPPDVERIQQCSLDVVRRNRAAGTLLDERQKISSVMCWREPC